MRYLTSAGITGKGMLTFFKKLQQQEYRYGVENIDPFMQTHPLSGERIAHMSADLQASPAWNTKIDPMLDERLRRVKAKLEGYTMPPERTLADFPDTDPSIYAHYARAYAFHKAGYPQKADAEAAALLKADPTNPYFQEIQGQILLEAGKPHEALAPLRSATQASGNNPLIATTFGHALIATEDKANYAEAIKVLRLAIGRDDDNPFAWYQLGTVVRTHRRRTARRAGDRGTREHDRRPAYRGAQRAHRDGGHPPQHHRLDPRAGHRDDRAERHRRQSQEI